jgi:hypothetical protein
MLLLLFRHSCCIGMECEASVECIRNAVYKRYGDDKWDHCPYSSYKVIGST